MEHIKTHLYHNSSFQETAEDTPLATNQACLIKVSFFFSVLYFWS